MKKKSGKLLQRSLKKPGKINIKLSEEISKKSIQNLKSGPITNEDHQCGWEDNSVRKASVPKELRPKNKNQKTKKMKL